MSFAEGIVCPRASQIYCDTTPLFGKDIPISRFRLIFRGGDGGDEGPCWEKVNIPGLLTGVKRVVIGRRVRRVPAVQSAFMHWG